MAHRMVEARAHRVRPPECHCSVHMYCRTRRLKEHRTACMSRLAERVPTLLVVLQTVLSQLRQGTDPARPCQRTMAQVVLELAHEQQVMLLGDRGEYMTHQKALMFQMRRYLSHDQCAQEQF